MMKIDFVCATNDSKVLEENIKKSRIFSSENFILQDGFSNVPLAYNEAIKQCTGDILCFLHHDVFMPDDFGSLLLKSLEEMEKFDRNWGVLGVAGAVLLGSNKIVYVGHLRDRGREWGKAGNLPATVDTLDELLLIIKNDGTLRFDEKIPTNHFYGADICLQARLQNKRSYAISAYCHHNSRHLDIPTDFWPAAGYIGKKYRDLLPIATTCIILK